MAIPGIDRLVELRFNNQFSNEYEKPQAQQHTFWEFMAKTVQKKLPFLPHFLNKYVCTPKLWQFPLERYL